MKTIIFRDNDLREMKKAEKKKTLFENKGYTLIETKKINGIWFYNYKEN